MIENTLTSENEKGYQVIAVNIKYGRELKKFNDRPDMVTFDIPDGILKTMDREELFKDNIESFVYNTLTRKYGAEVNRCQIWLPIE